MKCEICHRNKVYHKHHIISKMYGGSNDSHNIAHLCANCHSDVHSGSVVIEGRFLTDEGYALIWHRNGDESITGMEDLERVYLI